MTPERLAVFAHVAPTCAACAPIVAELRKQENDLHERWEASEAELAAIRAALEGVLPPIPCPAGCRGGFQMANHHGIPCKTCNTEGTIDPVHGPATTLELVDRALRHRAYTADDIQRGVDAAKFAVETVKAETLEAAAVLCDKEGNVRYERARRESRDGDEDQERIQDHKAITAYALAAAIRAMS